MGLIVPRLRRAVASAWPDAWRRSPSPKVVVLGFHKSGTSAIAHLLADRAGWTKAIDLPPVWQPTLTEVLQGRLTLADIVNGNPEPFRRQLIKEPNFSVIPEQVADVFPRSRFVFVIRDPRDTIRSLLQRMKLRGDLDSIDETVARDAWRAMVDPQLTPDPDAHYIDVISYWWVKAVEGCMAQFPDAPVIRYEDFLTDKVAEIDRLANQIGAPIRNEISNRVDVAYQPRGRGVRDPERFFGANLPRIEASCAEVAGRFGYSLGDG